MNEHILNVINEINDLQSEEKRLIEIVYSMTMQLRGGSRSLTTEMLKQREMELDAIRKKLTTKLLERSRLFI